MANAILAVLVAIIVWAWSTGASLSSDDSGENDMASALALAINKAEGNAPNDVAMTANNPGDLELGDIGNGTIGGKTIFASLDDGFEALENQINLIVTGQSKAGYTPDMSIAQVAQIWTGGDNPSAWANIVASELGVTPDTSFASVAG